MIRHFTGNFENETPQSDSGTIISGFADNKKKGQKKIYVCQKNLGLVLLKYFPDLF
jgi:uncharacterized protein YwgA